MLRLHLESGRFRAGVVAGRWRLVSFDWPYVVVGVKARDGIEYGFRFHCADYPLTDRWLDLRHIRITAVIAIVDFPTLGSVKCI